MAHALEAGDGQQSTALPPMSEWVRTGAGGARRLSKETSSGRQRGARAGNAAASWTTGLQEALPHD
jgi:hypothetical protein